MESAELSWFTAGTPGGWGLVVIAGLFLSLLGRVATCPIIQTTEILVSPPASSRLIHTGWRWKAGWAWARKEQLNAFDLQWMYYLPSELNTVGSTGRFSVGHKGQELVSHWDGKVPSIALLVLCWCQNFLSPCCWWQGTVCEGDILLRYPFPFHLPSPACSTQHFLVPLQGISRQVLVARQNFSPKTWRHWQSPPWISKHR